MPMKFTVAIDGPAAAGKGTIGRALAQRFGFGYLDTGLLYRAVAWKAEEGQTPVAAALGLAAEDLQVPELRSAEVGQAASAIATLPEVRAALAAFQKRFARRPGGAVLDGRDIGTVICPEAEMKLYVTASDEVRATRRHAELAALGGNMTFEEVLVDLRMRDARDAGRAHAPLCAAPDALLLDTSSLSIDAAVEKAVGAIELVLLHSRNPDQS